MKKISIFCLLAFAALCSLTSCKDDPAIIVNVPTLELMEPTNLTRHSVTLHGMILTTHHTDAYIIDHGFLFSSTSDFTSGDTREFSLDSESLRDIELTIDDLVLGATYFYALYADNGLDRQISVVKSLTMPDKMPAEIVDFEQVNNTRSIFSARIADDGDGEIKRVGFCWSEEPNPTIYEGEFLVADLQSDDTFSLSLPLEPHKSYYVRAFVQSQITEAESLTDSYSEQIDIIPGPADNEIWYTSTDGKVVEPSTSAFNAKITSNTYENGRGVIVFDETITKIGVNAFRERKNLSAITLPDVIESIGESAFWACGNLSAFYGKYASEDNRCLIKDDVLLCFAPNGITEYSIPNGVKTIGNASFFTCEYIEKITIPNTVTIIDEYAFQHCTLLSDISIPESVTHIESYAFSFNNALEEIHIGNNVTHIGDGAFYNCAELKYVNIPASVTYMGEAAFMSCPELLNVLCYPVTPPETTEVVSIFTANSSGRKIFVPNESLESYKNHARWKKYKDDLLGLNESDDWRTIRYTSTDGKIVEPYKSDVFGANIVSNTYENGEGEIVFHTHVSKIGVMAFLGATNLKSIVIPEGVTSVDEQAFSQCSNLEEVLIPSSVEKIDIGAFGFCANLQTINIEEGVRDLGNYAFLDCSSLKQITLPSTLSRIGEGAFYGCEALENIVIPDFVRTVGIGAFQDCSNLSSATIGSGVTRISDNLFVNCVNLKNLYIRSGVKSIGKTVFYGCNNLETVTIPDSVITIDEDAFFYCSGLTSIVIPNSVTTIGKSVFSACVNLENVTIGTGITEFSEYMLSFTGIKTIIIPDNIVKIGYGAFYSCPYLQEIIIGDNVENIDTAAFYECTSLSNLKLGRGVSTIGKKAFYGCTSLSEVTIPSNVKEVGQEAFWLCSNLSDVTLEEGVEMLGDAAFAECTNLQRIEIPASVISIGNGAFNTASSLEEVYCLSTTPPTMGVYVFAKNAEGRKIYVPAESLEAYKSAEGWSDYAADIYPIEASEPEPAITFDFAADVTESSFSLTVTPSSEEVYYMGECFIKSDYEAKVAQYGSIDTYMTAFLSDPTNSLGTMEQTLSFYASYGYFAHKGVWSTTYNSLPADTEFVVVTYMLDMYTCDALSDIITYEFKTLPSTSTPAITFDFAADVTESSFSLTVTPSSEEVYYMGECFIKSDYEAKVAQYGSIDTYMTAFLSDPANSLGTMEQTLSFYASYGYFAHKGVWSTTYNSLPADTEFVVVCYQVDMTTSSAMSEIVTYGFKTLPASTPIPEELFQFTVETTENSFSLTVTPSSEEYYMGECFIKSDYEAKVAQYGSIDAYMKEYIATEFSGMSFEFVLPLLYDYNLFVHKGNWTVGYSDLPSNTEFIVVTYLLDMSTCNALSDVTTCEFKTLPSATASAANRTINSLGHKRLSELIRSNK